MFDEEVPIVNQNAEAFCNSGKGVGFYLFPKLRTSCEVRQLAGHSATKKGHFGIVAIWLILVVGVRMLMMFYTQNGVTSVTSDNSIEITNMGEERISHNNSVGEWYIEFRLTWIISVGQWTTVLSNLKIIQTLGKPWYRTSSHIHPFDKIRRNLQYKIIWL
jgi:hypothetical protein